MSCSTRSRRSALREWVVQQRWFGSKARDVAHLNVLEAFTLRAEAPQLVLALVEARFPAGTHEVYQVPIGIRPASDGWSERVIAEVGGKTYYDALADPAHARELLHLMRSNADVQAGEGTLGFRWSGGAGEGGTVEVRPVGVEQSNSSIVFGEALILKAFRRVEPGVNPELELLRFLSERDFPHIAPIAGWFQYDGRLMDATLGVLQEYLAGATDGWDLALDALATDPEAFLAHVRALGVVTGELHSALGSEGSDPAFAPEEPSTEAIAILTATIDEEIERIFVELPDDPGARPDPRPRPGRPGAPAGARGLRRRRARHPHPRRLPPRPDHARRARLGDPRLRGRARAPDLPAPAQALAAARRRRDAALVLLRRGGLADPARRAAARGLGGARARDVPRPATSRPSTRRCCRRATRRRARCWRSSSSRRRSTSCATS